MEHYADIGIWDIEVSYYEGKTFWPMEEHLVCSKEGIERLINLISLSYSAMTLLPYSDEAYLGTSLPAPRRPGMKLASKSSQK